ncbi:MAG: hypothetical protein HQL52_19845 [Magnetococcales bacterium]|nr:hypothetical protein [Magnetococcales bacterium]
MKKLFLGVVGLGFSLLVAGPTLAESHSEDADDQNQHEATCRKWADEDQVPVDDLERYVADCLSGFGEAPEEPTGQDEYSEQDMEPGSSY